MGRTLHPVPKSPLGNQWRGNRLHAPDWDWDCPGQDDQRSLALARCWRGHSCPAALGLRHAVAGAALSWFQSYLSNKEQFVEVQGMMSTPGFVEYIEYHRGLCWVRFCLCFTWHSLMTINCSRHSVHHHSFADGTQLQRSCTPEVNTWMTENKLQLN